MILPIVAYGDPVLKKKAKPIDKDYPKLEELIDIYSNQYFLKNNYCRGWLESKLRELSKDINY